MIQALWNYIKINGLQDKVERRTVRTNDELRAVSSPADGVSLSGADNDFTQLFGAETVYFTQLPEIVNRFLMPPDPIVLHYVINPTAAPPERPTPWDVEVKLEDLALKHRMKSVTLDANQATLKTLGDIDDEVRCARVPPSFCQHGFSFPARSQCTYSHYTTLPTSPRSSGRFHRNPQSSFKPGWPLNLGIWRPFWEVGYRTVLR